VDYWKKCSELEVGCIPSMEMTNDTTKRVPAENSPTPKLVYKLEVEVDVRVMHTL
jgi:hypothetical protein